MRRCSTNGKLSREHISCSATQDPVPITCIDFDAYGRPSTCGVHACAPPRMYMYM
jgi:hypothetical protein